MHILALPANVAVSVLIVVRGHNSRRPYNLASQSTLEMTDGLHYDRIHKLLMKLRVAFARSQSVLRGNFLMPQIYRVVPTVACRVEVDNFEVLADRARF